MEMANRIMEVVSLLMAVIAIILSQIDYATLFLGWVIIFRLSRMESNETKSVQKQLDITNERLNKVTYIKVSEDK